ncbi:MAG: hypothetical protein M0Z70_14210 [Nitrospiraceae bacterium]|jgi:hypothetical protein|nr:hypothetical protein [Nitrospiraceae bacterium]
MFELDIPGFGFIRLEHLVSDFTGTLSVDGNLKTPSYNSLTFYTMVSYIFIINGRNII